MENFSQEFQGSHNKFSATIKNALRPFLEKTISENKDEWNSVTKNILFWENLTGKRNIKIEPTEKNLIEMFEGFLEIEISFNSLNETTSFLNRYPSNLPKKSGYLEFVITGYLNEVYIFSNRIDSYTKKIIRKYRNSPHARGKITLLNTVQQILVNYFNNIKDKRGRHVHKRRYHDNEFSRLILLEILMEEKTLAPDFIIPIYKKSLLENKRKWKLFFQNKNNEHRQILDLYFAALYPIIFDEQGKFINPK